MRSTTRRNATSSDDAPFDGYLAAAVPQPGYCSSAPPRGVRLRRDETRPWPRPPAGPGFKNDLLLRPLPLGEHPVALMHLIRRYGASELRLQFRSDGAAPPRFLGFIEDDAVRADTVFDVSAARPPRSHRSGGQRRSAHILATMADEDFRHARNLSSSSEARWESEDVL
jgi:hypothetical protein